MVISVLHKEYSAHNRYLWTHGWIINSLTQMTIWLFLKRSLLPQYTWSAITYNLDFRYLFYNHNFFFTWLDILCGRHVIRKAFWRISKLEIWNLKSAVSALCGCLSFACFEKKWGKVSWIFQNSSIRHITNTFSYDMPTT